MQKLKFDLKRPGNQAKSARADLGIATGSWVGQGILTIQVETGTFCRKFEFP